MTRFAGTVGGQKSAFFDPFGQAVAADDPVGQHVGRTVFRARTAGGFQHTRPVVGMDEVAEGGDAGEDEAVVEAVEDAPVEDAEPAPAEAKKEPEAKKTPKDAKPAEAKNAKKAKSAKGSKPAIKKVS